MSVDLCWSPSSNAVSVGVVTDVVYSKQLTEAGTQLNRAVLRDLISLAMSGFL